MKNINNQINQKARRGKSGCQVLSPPFRQKNPFPSLTTESPISQIWSIFLQKNPRFLEFGRFSYKRSLFLRILLYVRGKKASFVKREHKTMLRRRALWYLMLQGNMGRHQQGLNKGMHKEQCYGGCAETEWRMAITACPAPSWLCRSVSHFA